jgi:deoxyribodipyrimidine photolyase-related protein
MTKQFRRLCIILGDQLDQQSVLFDDFDKSHDKLWMAETLQESREPLSSQQRSVFFLSAMRHFAEELRQQDYPLIYFSLDKNPVADFIQALEKTFADYQFESIRLVLPGDYRLLQVFKQFAKQQQIECDFLADHHFIAKPGEFTQWQEGKKQLRMEYWYRQLRKRTGILMQGSKPEGGEWNYDKENRKSFNKSGPNIQPGVLLFPADDITQSTIKTVQHYFSKNPGDTTHTGWPVTRAESLQLLQFFIEHYLPWFGDYQDAMWQDEAFLYHSRLSAALNVKLISPLEVIQAAEQSYRDNKAPLNAVEGFIRQILGWREFVHGLYWTFMPQWLDMNALNAEQHLPDFYWNADVDMNCLKESLSQVINTGYGHHIQRLMVTGLFAQLWQTQPQQIHQWYLAMYLDAIEWVELPNVLGMSQYADGGLMASKPYIATGRYIQKMSNYCNQCPFDPTEATGEKACPFTTLYWHFLEKHRELLEDHPRLGLQVKHLDNFSDEKRQQIREQAAKLRNTYPATGLWHA